MMKSEYAKPTLIDHGSIADHTFKKRPPRGPNKPKKPTPPGFSA